MFGDSKLSVKSPQAINQVYLTKATDGSVLNDHDFVVLTPTSLRPPQTAALPSNTASRPVLTKVALTKNSDNSVLSEMLFIFQSDKGSSGDVSPETVLLYPPTRE